MKNKPKKIIVHHSADNSKGCQLSKIDNWHKHRKFPQARNGKYIGYHKCICPIHGIHHIRDDDEIGAHDKGENINSLGVCMFGNFDKIKPSKKIEENLGKVLGEWVNKYNLTALDIEPHRKHDDTNCYGSLLADKWASLVYIKYELNNLTKILSWILISLQKLTASRKSDEK